MGYTLERLALMQFVQQDGTASGKSRTFAELEPIESRSE
jgi:hypothetical protein